MKKQKLLLFVFAFILIAIFIGSYNKYYHSINSYKKRVNTVVEYWSTLVPSGTVADITTKYGEPLKHEIQKISGISSPDKRDEIHTLHYDGFRVTTTNSPDGYSLVTEVMVKTKKIKIKYGLRIGTDMDKVLSVLGQPFDRKVFSDVTVLSYVPVYDTKDLNKILGYVQFYYVNNQLTVINWQPVLDD